jgi:hypothetical protein
LTPDASCPLEHASLYRNDFGAMLELPEPYVRRHPAIYTHNTWGEYGHEEHIQVRNAVQALAQHHLCSVPAWTVSMSGSSWQTGYG